MKKITYLAVLSAVFFISVGANILSSTGKDGVAGSPNEGTCANSGCHTSFALNSGPGSVVISSNIPNDQYVPGTLYQMSVTVSQQGVNLFGLCTEALTSANTNAGGLTITMGLETQIKTAANGRKCVTHKSNGGAGTNTKEFKFNWLAPAAGTGAVTFYTSGMASNASGTKTGDYIYSTTKVFTEATTSVDDAAANIVITASPNPAKDVLKVTVNKTGTKTLHLVDMQGKVVLSETTTAETANLKVANLAAGMYSVQIWNENKELLGTKKVLVGDK
ncbi:MAG: choice-of-anchor V domain-containing protein [Bacteroidia bacterium]